MTRRRASNVPGPRKSGRVSSSSSLQSSPPLDRSTQHADAPRLPWLAEVERRLVANVTPTAGGNRGRRSAVLVVLVDAGGGPQVLLTRRSESLRYLQGAVTFPGGAVEVADSGPVDTALREAEEETGLDPSSVDLLGQLPDRITPDGEFIVTPVVAWSRHLCFDASPNPDEVVGMGLVHLAALAPLLTSGRPAQVHLPSGSSDVPADRSAGTVAPLTAVLLAEVVTACQI